MTRLIFRHHVWYLFSRTLDADAPAEGRFRYSRVDVADLEALAVFRPYRRREEFRQWLERGDLVFLALDGEGPVAFLSLRVTPPAHAPVTAVWSESSLWFGDIYVRPEYRGHQVLGPLSAYAEAHVRRLGFTESVGVVDADNWASLAYVVRQLQPLRTAHRVGFLRVLWLTRTRVEAIPVAEVKAALRASRRRALASPAGDLLPHR